jgi:hypothetical protein
MKMVDPSLPMQLLADGEEDPTMTMMMMTTTMTMTMTTTTTMMMICQVVMKKKGSMMKQ